MKRREFLKASTLSMAALTGVVALLPLTEFIKDPKYKDTELSMYANCFKCKKKIKLTRVHLANKGKLLLGGYECKCGKGSSDLVRNVSNITGKLRRRVPEIDKL